MKFQLTLKLGGNRLVECYQRSQRYALGIECGYGVIAPSQIDCAARLDKRIEQLRVERQLSAMVRHIHLRLHAFHASLTYLQLRNLNSRSELRIIQGSLPAGRSA